jgi:uncharacterized protein YciI
MEFFCYHRDRADSDSLRGELGEAHWSFMDGYADRMIARGPTLSEDGEYATGSVHIVDLLGPAEARGFAFDEPNYQAGVYRDVLLRRWHDVLGRTMWQFTGGGAPGGCYLIVGLGDPRPIDGAPDTTLPADTDRLVAYGSLVADDGTTWLGTAALVHAPTPDDARAVLTHAAYAEIDVQPWQPGGRSG